MNPAKLIGGGGSGGTLAVAIVYLGSRLGWHLTAEDGTAAALFAVAAGAFLAHNGLLGLFQIVLRGDRAGQKGAAAEPVTVTPVATAASPAVVTITTPPAA